MAIIKRRQFKEMSKDDMKKRLNELRIELTKERSQVAVGGSAASPGRIKEIRKTIARIKTHLRRGEVVG